MSYQASSLAKLPSITLVLCASRIEECGVAEEVDRDERLVAVLEDALERAVGGALHRRVDLLGGGLAAQPDREVDARTRRRWARASRSRRACPSARAARGRSHGRRRCWSGSSRSPPRGRAGGPCAGSRGSPGRWCRRGSWSSSRSRCRTRRSAPWRPAPGSWWCRRRSRRCGAWRGRRRRVLTPSTIVTSGSVAGAVMITRSAPGLEVLGGSGPVGEGAGRLEHDLGAELLPGQLGRVAFRRDGNLPPVHDDGVARRPSRRRGSGGGSSRT